MTSTHDGLLTVNLQAAGDNFLALERRLRPGSRCGAVVKADAYGLGVNELAPAFYRRGCRDFFVATLDEGLELRDILDEDARVFVLTGVRPGRELECIRAGLIPNLFTLQQVRAWRNAREAAGSPAPCALKIDSGMTRLGMTEEEFGELLRDPGLLQDADIRVLMSHLACAEDPGHPHNRRQLEAFGRAGARLRERLPEVQLSLANSSGIHLDEAYHFDIARPGSALYGVNPQPAGENPMRAVVTLSLPVVQQRHVAQDSWVGYGATQRAPAGSWLAVARGGYADGIIRAQGGRGCGWAFGRRLPMIGRVSMDSTVFDISALAPAERSGLGHIEVLNEVVTVDEVAEYAGTIGYEILTSLGHRYTRRYTGS
ncbi:alanine racemase [Microbulbifer sediminum]|uniref:alanine racemase n=1 Tax=Microbulbifer sediminum TaxID=2904250 RepID=UPI001F02B4FD|nr:alanine racemase [Microbulbifer sediminum]